MSIAVPQQVTDLAGTLTGTARGVLAFIRRDLAERSVLRVPVLLDLVLGVINLVVFVFVSRAVHGGGARFAANGNSYFDFVAIGIAFMLVVQAAVTQSAMRVSEEQRSGTIEQLVASPTRIAAVALGLGAYPVLFAMLRTAVYLLLAGLVLGLDVSHTDWLGLVVVLLLGGIATAGIGVALAAFVVAASFGTSGSRVVLVALTFVSGTYFPVATLPGWARALGWPLPTRLALDGLREAVAGSSWVGSAAGLLATIVVVLPLSVLVFAAAVRLAARRGTLVRG